MKNWIAHSLWLLIGLIGLIGCRGTLQAGVEITSTPDRAIPATLAALVEENNRLATRVAAQEAIVPAALNLGQLAYVQGGDIWTLPVLDEAAAPRRLTLDGHNREPHWSISGKWLAYRKERSLAPADTSADNARKQVWLIQADGTSEHPLNQGLSVEVFAWSPVADRLAFATATGGLSTINADGTNPVVLVPDNLTAPIGETQATRLSWSPDGKWIAYEWRIQPASRPLIYQGVWLVAADGGTPIELYKSGVPEKSESVLAGWSALGDEVLFWQNDTAEEGVQDGAPLFSITTRVPRSSEMSARKVSDSKTLTYLDFVAVAPRNSVWKDQTALAFIVGEGRSTWHNKRIVSVGQTLTSDQLAVTTLDWSPDGKRLAFAAMPDQGELGSRDEAALLRQRRIWVANALGDPQPRRLTGEAYRDERPLWSADGNYLLFARLDDKGVASLWLMPAAGGEPVRLVTELTPAPDPLEADGHIDWTNYFDWWRGP